MVPRFVSEEDVADGANVATLEVGTVGAVPAGLQAAADTVCGKDGQQGKVSGWVLFHAVLPAPKFVSQSVWDSIPQCLHA